MTMLSVAQEKELEQNIAEAIRTNTCPFTTDADIRYIETEEFHKNLLPKRESDFCICGELLTNNEEHYIHMSKGY